VSDHPWTFWLEVACNRQDNQGMKHHDSIRHPGPWRVMRVDSEFVGIIVAVGFVLMGLVGIPIAKWFLLGALVLGAGVALVLRLIRKSS
jgi:hypothetical protein